ncbi:MAG: hypothetical protein R2806_12065 [Saprospiraceae bacterium]
MSKTESALSSGMLIANLIPHPCHLRRGPWETDLGEALVAATGHITGKAVTCFSWLTCTVYPKGNREANKVLVPGQCAFHAQIAKHYATLH